MTSVGSEFAEDFLAHYGVKGMRWGIRKAEGSTNTESSPTITPEPTGKNFGLTKKQAAIGASILVGVALTSMVVADVGGVRSSTLARGYRESTMSNGKEKLELILRDNAKHPIGDSILSAGQTFSRMSTAAETDIRRGAYATYKDRDVAQYKAFWSQKGYQINIEALRDIKMPDLQTRIDTMAELINSDKSIRKGVVAQQRTARAKLWATTAPSKELAENMYAKFDAPDWKRGPGKKFLEALVSKGYGAMVDDVDSGKLSGDPVILINEKLFHITGKTKMTQADLDEAYRSFKSTLSS